MIFWDSSALVPLLIPEKQSEYCFQVLKRDQEILIWFLSQVEVVSALTRRLREGNMQPDHFQLAKKRLERLVKSAFQVTAFEKVRMRALRLLEVHPLRAADACQLASSLIVTQEDPARLAMLCFDQRLQEAAVKEGFVVNPADQNSS